MIANIFRQKRLFISRIISIFLFFVFVFTKTPIKSDVAKAILDNVGLLLIVAGVLGRLWSSMYICGYKSFELIKAGPYAAVRNPLYIFSFIGVSGIALSTQNYIFIGLILALFLIYYPLVIISEENKLKKMHQDKFVDYMRETPRFIPKFSRFTMPEKQEIYRINVKSFSKAFLDSTWFFIFYVLIDIIKILQSKGVIPIIINFVH